VLLPTAAPEPCELGKEPIGALRQRRGGLEPDLDQDRPSRVQIHVPGEPGQQSPRWNPHSAIHGRVQVQPYRPAGRGIARINELYDDLLRLVPPRTMRALS